MQRSDYAFRDLSDEDYERAVTNGTMPGYTSPMHGQANYDALIRVMREADIDPRLPLAFAHDEGHMGSDPGLVAAPYHNLGGIKFVGAPGTFDTGIAADTGGTYAGFADMEPYYREWVRVMNNGIIGPDFQGGNLVGAVEHYVNGPGTGHGRIDKFLEYQQAYPRNASGATVSDVGVYGEDIINYVRTLIGQAYSTTQTDPANGVHPWAYWCESLAERGPEHLGLVVVHRGSATEKGNALRDQGLFRPDGQPRHGDWVVFGPSFYYPDGHIGFWDEEKGMLLGTLTDGTGIGYRQWGPRTVGFMGCALIPGVVGPHRGGIAPAPVPAESHPPMEQNWVPAGNPYDPNAGVKGKEIGIGGAFLALYRATSEPFQTFGWPTENERQALVDGVRHTIQRFERAVFVYNPDAPPPWRAVVAMESAKIEVLS